ncbi:hypothetical protein [Ruegeria marina]|uniref:Sulfotransferase family protein n=1 Tax=Ruegeria marina TaxID=639004 RepID=A0A1G7E9T4_9RHOB|nr:hypothetical protein [Ruegeria marina]SDE60409.1 hypothetical protein SAMN04488239_12444 [Ruegeria marina]
MTDRPDLQGFLEDTLALLDPIMPADSLDGASDEALEGLLAQCQRQVTRIQATARQPLRLIHHFACTGGTLMSRALASQPNTMLLSEVDPFSTNRRISPGFAPSDLIHLARQNRTPPGQDTITEMFLQQLDVLHRATQGEGRHLVIRDHTHSHFCEFADPGDRPLMRDIVSGRFETRALLTVRHPLDSYASLRHNGWARGLTDTLEGYARCYLRFLDAYRGLEIFHYERFAQHPDLECRRMTECLALEFEPRWQDFLPAIHLTGDSGRKSASIVQRPRRPLTEALRSQFEAAMPDCYRELCDRLGYDPDPAGSVLPMT